MGLHGKEGVLEEVGVLEGEGFDAQEVAAAVEEE